MLISTSQMGFFFSLFSGLRHIKLSLLQFLDLEDITSDSEKLGWIGWLIDDESNRSFP